MKLIQVIQVVSYIGYLPIHYLNVIVVQKETGIYLRNNNLTKKII